MGKYTKEQLIFFLKKLSSELKKTPTIKELNKKKRYPSSTTYINRFGSWNNSLRKAALKINMRKKYRNDELVENLHLLAKELGRIPKAIDLKSKKWTASYTTYRKHFGTWKNALKEAGITQAGSFLNLKQFSKGKRK